MTNFNNYSINSISTPAYLLILSPYTSHQKLNNTTHMSSTPTLSRNSVSTLLVAVTTLSNDDITYLNDLMDTAKANQDQHQLRPRINQLYDSMLHLKISFE